MERTVLSDPERTEGGAGVETVGHATDAARLHEAADCSETGDIRQGDGRHLLRAKPGQFSAFSASPRVVSP